LSKFIFRIFWVISLIIFASIFITPQFFWLTGVLSLLIPLVIIMHLAFLVYFVIKPSNKIWYSITVLAVGLLFLSRTISLHGPIEGEGSLSVLSYNVRVFNVYSHLNKNFEISKSTIQWTINRDDDVLCLQEFYYEPNSEIFNTLEILSKDYPHFHFQPKATNQIGAQFGMAIFSKHPIIDQGSLDITRHSMNDILFTDLNLGSDTVRIYNVHLESMSIDENQLTNSNSENFSQNLGELFSQLRYGFSQRAAQIDKLCDHIQGSPYPVILTGDLNDVPYSYSYQKLKKYLHSSFENAGKGFGFTFNGKLFFLRIDNQFYSEDLEIKKFQTLRKVKYTDHFPIYGEYSFD